MFSKKRILFIFVGLAALLIMGCSSDGDDLTKDEGEIDDAVAIVNGDEISREVFEDIVERMVLSYEQQGLSFEGEEGEAALDLLRQQVINSLVQEKVLLQEAEKKGYHVSDEEVEKELELIKKQFSSEEEYKTTLQDNQLTEEEIKRSLFSEMVIEQFIEKEVQEVTISEEEVRMMYDQYKAQMEAQKEEGAEETEESLEMPAFEEIKQQLEAQIKQQKEQTMFSEMIEKLMEKSEIEIFM